MKSDIKEAVMVYEKARMYAYLSAEITSLYHEAAVCALRKRGTMPPT